MQQAARTASRTIAHRLYGYGIAYRLCGLAPALSTSCTHSLDQTSVRPSGNRGPCGLQASSERITWHLVCSRAPRRGNARCAPTAPPRAPPVSHHPRALEAEVLVVAIRHRGGLEIPHELEELILLVTLEQAARKRGTRPPAGSVGCGDLRAATCGRGSRT